MPIKPPKIYLLLCIVMSLLCSSSCSSLFFYPNKKVAVRPEALNINYEDIWIENEGQPKLHAWYLPSPNPIALVIHLHGNAENISAHFPSVYWMPAKGLSVLTLDYRGYGESEGSANLEGIHHDVERAIDFVLQSGEVADKKLVLFGQSLGASLALYTAAKEKYQGKIDLVVAESAFSSYRKIAREKLASTWLTYPLQWPLSFLIPDRFSAINEVPHIAPTPVILIHGTQDQVVNFESSEQLCEKLGENCTFWRIDNGGHIGAFRDNFRREQLVNAIRHLYTER